MPCPALSVLQRGQGIRRIILVEWNFHSCSSSKGRKLYLRSTTTILNVPGFGRGRPVVAGSNSAVGM
jgi:hypothetical protein